MTASTARIVQSTVIICPTLPRCCRHWPLRLPAKSDRMAASPARRTRPTDALLDGDSRCRPLADRATRPVGPGVAAVQAVRRRTHRGLVPGRVAVAGAGDP